MIPSYAETTVVPSASKLRGWPPASFPALHEQGLPQGLVQPVPPLCGTMVTVQCGSVRSRCVPALVPRCVQVPARMQGLSSSVHWRGSAERLPSHTVDHVWAIGADNHLPFPTLHVRTGRWGQCLVAFQGSTHIRVVCLVPETQSHAGI